MYRRLTGPSGFVNPPALVVGDRHRVSAVAVYHGNRRITGTEESGSLLTRRRILAVLDMWLYIFRKALRDAKRQLQVM